MNNLKVAREKWLIMHEGSPGRLKPDFSRETTEARRQQDDIGKVLKERKMSTTILTYNKIPFKMNTKQISSPINKN